MTPCYATLYEDWLVKYREYATKDNATIDDMMRILRCTHGPTAVAETVASSAASDVGNGSRWLEAIAGRSCEEFFRGSQR
jgi:hypothetical protein